MNSKTDELDYIVSIMKKNKDKKDLKKAKTIIEKPETKVVFSTYKMGASKIHKNITLDEEIVQ